MIEPAIVLVRLLQYLGAAVLFGSSLFFVYAAPTLWPQRLLAVAAGLLAAGSLLAIAAQASLFAGSLAAGLTGEALGGVAISMDFGKAALVRTATAGLAFVLLMAPGVRLVRLAVIGLAAVATASLAWLGHGASAESAWQLTGHMIHALSAAVWLGALAGFVVLVRRELDLAMVHAALRRFSRIGIPLVAVLVLSGLANSWFVIGPDNVKALATTPYGQLLLAKLALFASMLLFAARNRVHHTAAIAADLAASPDPRNRARLGRSIMAEAALGFGVLAAVASIGLLAPPSTA